MVFPSGENRGWPSNPIPLVMRVALPPLMGTVYRSPSRSKTMVLPSGETSSDIQVPSSVVNDAWRVGRIGRSVLGAVFLAMSAGFLVVSAGLSCASATKKGLRHRAAAIETRRAIDQDI